MGGGGGLLKQNVKIVGSPRAASYLPFISCLSIYSGVRELMDGKITSRAGNPQSRVPTSVRASERNEKSIGGHRTGHWGQMRSTEEQIQRF